MYRIRKFINHIYKSINNIHVSKYIYSTNNDGYSEINIYSNYNKQSYYSISDYITKNINGCCYIYELNNTIKIWFNDSDKMLMINDHYILVINHDDHNYPSVYTIINMKGEVSRF